MFQVYTPPSMPADEDAREADVIASGLLQSDRAMALHGIFWRAAQLCRTTMASATIVHGDRQFLIATVGIATGSTSRAVSFCGHAILDPGHVLCVPDSIEDVRFAGNPLVTDEPNIRFYAGAPLVSPRGHAIGTLCVLDRAPRASLTLREDSALRAMAAEVMVRSLKR